MRNSSHANDLRNLELKHVAFCFWKVVCLEGNVNRASLNDTSGFRVYGEDTERWTPYLWV